MEENPPLSVKPALGKICDPFVCFGRNGWILD
jgi:hypothetical protein